MYESFVGLEIHIQLLTKTKVFCGCKAEFGDEPNTNICPVCMGYPGVLPALNEKAMEMAYLVSYALNCEPNPVSVFERKNYFYPDLPKNYQISQFRSPVGINGFVDLKYRDIKKKVHIREVHLEEDAGKMIHAGDISLLDFNRAGTPLLEIVTMPDLEVGEEAELFLQKFRRMVRYLGVCDGNMEQGSMRCDANISVNLRNKGLGKKVEIKNLNSFKFVRKALNYEIERQTEILERGGVISQETRLWNENRDITESMRVKESENDYRYFPDPDLPPFRPGEEFLNLVKSKIVELPEERKKRFIEEYALTNLQANFICEEKDRADFFENTIKLGAEPEKTALWLASDVKKILNRYGTTLKKSNLTEKRLFELLSLLKEKKIHGRIAKRVLEVIFTDDKSPLEIIKDKGWEQITDRNILESSVEKVFRMHPETVKAIQEGDQKPVGFLIGEVMKQTSGRADPGILNEILKNKLSLTFIHVISMGGAITGEVNEDGTVVPGDPEKILKQVEERAEIHKKIRMEELSISNILSEEITPDDWSMLISRIYSLFESPDTSGIVITHGTDTLSYTASLLFWLFPQPPIPIVLTASMLPVAKGGLNRRNEETQEPELKSPASAEISKGIGVLDNLSRSIEEAAQISPGIYVFIDNEFLSPLNLKFEKVSSKGFRNWNLKQPVYMGKMVKNPSKELFKRERILNRLKSAINSTFLIKAFAGMRGDILIRMMDSGITNIILETYDTGTASLRESPYSLKEAFTAAKERSVKIFCTSQQETAIDFSKYITSHELWKGGAIPAGSLTTESVYTRVLACYILAESDEELNSLMEDIGAHTN